MDYRDYSSIYELFTEVSSKHAAQVAYRYKRDGAWQDVTWSEAGETVRRVSRALIALDVAKNDRVCLLASTRLEWSLLDFGIVCCGAVTVGIYPSNLSEDCAYIVDHADAEIVIVENVAQLDKIREVRDRLPRLRHVVLVDGQADDAMTWEQFLSTGDSTTVEELERRGAEIRPDDVASLVYTSGTTGVPKGAMITHLNLLFSTWSAGQCLSLEPHYSTLMFLPLAHVFARLISYCCMSYAIPMAFAEDVTKVGDNIKEVRPYFIASVPRVYEKVYDKVLSGAEAAGGVKLKLFNWALDTGLAVSRLQQQGRSIPAGLRMRHALADKLVLHKIRDALGGRLAWAVSGAAPLNKTIAEFFHACGVTILEGIGMTENTSFTNVNRLGANKFGTVGQPGPGVEQKIAEDGEVLYRGLNVMKGYFKSPEATAEAIDAEGWLHTGDIGDVDDDGFLRITDRKKDLIITAGGKNVAPQRIEKIMRTSHYIAQAVAYGDKRKFITALITLDPENIVRWAGENGLETTDVEGLSRDPRVEQLIRSEIEERNRQLASFETIKRFHILPRDLTIEDGELTPTLKIKRKVVTERYAAELESLYTDD